MQRNAIISGSVCRSAHARFRCRSALKAAHFGGPDICGIMSAIARSISVASNVRLVEGVTGAGTRMAHGIVAYHSTSTEQMTPSALPTSQAALFRGAKRHGRWFASGTNARASRRGMPLAPTTSNREGGSAPAKRPCCPSGSPGTRGRLSAGRGIQPHASIGNRQRFDSAVRLV